MKNQESVSDEWVLSCGRREALWLTRGERSGKVRSESQAITCSDMPECSRFHQHAGPDVFRDHHPGFLGALLDQRFSPIRHPKLHHLCFHGPSCVRQRE